MPAPTASTALSQGQQSVTQYRAPKKPKGDTPEERLTPEAQDVPDIPVRLADGWLACRSCGVAVQTEDSDDAITVEASELGVDPAPVKSLQNPLRVIEGRARTTLTFALCPDHLRTQELAEKLVDSSNHPSLRDRMAAALDALSFVAPAQLARIEAAGLDPEGRNALVSKLAHLGQQAHWISRFVPSISADAVPRTCCRYPWAHLMPGARAELRTAYATLLRERVARRAPAVPIPPPRVSDRGAGSNLVIPVEGGCLFCGVSHQLAPAVTVAQEGLQNVARSLWTPKRATSEQLGGPRSPTALSGWLCRRCADAASHVGSLGPSALERALVAALTPSGLDKLGWGLTVDGLVGWGALVARAQQGNPPGQPAPSPNAVAFAHLGDLSEIREQLRRRLG